MVEPGTRFIRIAGAKVGIVGLDEELQKLLPEADSMNEEQLLSRLIERLSINNYIPDKARPAYIATLRTELARLLGAGEHDPKTILEVRVLGPGCPRCHLLMETVRNLLAKYRLDADLAHVCDLNEIAAYGPIATPALVVNGRILSSGRVPTEEQILAWLKSTG